MDVLSEPPKFTVNARFKKLWCHVNAVISDRVNFCN
jgi:hypothetical protein